MHQPLNSFHQCLNLVACSRASRKPNRAMAYDKNASPVGWYFGSYLLRFVELRDVQRKNPERRFASWENTVIVKADTLESAYSKIEKIGKAESKPYRGGLNGIR